MQYMLLIYDDERVLGGMAEEERQALMGDYFGYTTELRESGAFVDGAPLQSVQTATTVRIRDGETLTTDGPFAETKEQLGGFYVLECKDLDEAIGWAAKIPGAKSGCVEVRPVIQYEG